MASLCRSATILSTRSATSRAILPKSATAKALTSPIASSIRTIHGVSRVASALGGVESLMPLHSAIANARLKSIIAFDSSCWSWISQGLALPL